MTEIHSRPPPSSLEGHHHKVKPLICLRDLSNYRGEGGNAMPDSPEAKPAVATSMAASMSPVAGLPPITVRPHSSGSSMSGLTGAHSPQSILNGPTPSPPGMAGSGGSSQQLPPACGARQLSKLKRFLTTLQQFGSDISPEIGDRVRSLVLGLVNSHLSIEEFHGKLQEATNFPLRPFVIPFLKANLPLLQRELLHCARLAKQTPQQYLAHNEHILFDPAHSPLESHDLISPEFNENGKRPSPDRPKENGLEPHLDSLHPAKRPHTVSPVGSSSSRISPNMTPFSTSSAFPHLSGPIRLEDISVSREMRERVDRDRMERDRVERERHFNFNNYHRQDPFDHLERLEEDWKSVENMLHSIVGMVDKCKRALAALQERSQRDREEMAMWLRRHEMVDMDLKKRDMMTTGLRGGAEDRLNDVKRRAEDAVNEVKRQAVTELQKAVAAAETKATDLVASERLKMERELAAAKKHAQEEVLTSINRQEESNESCWNCGRKASETCSGCNVARYCGSFCQHKDWENHHRVCGQGLQATMASRTRHKPSGDSGDGSSKSAPPQQAPSLAAVSKTTPTHTPKLLLQNSPSTTAASKSDRSSVSPTPVATVVPASSPATSPANTNSRSASRSNSPAEESETKKA